MGYIENGPSDDLKCSCGARVELHAVKDGSDPLWVMVADGHLEDVTAEVILGPSKEEALSLFAQRGLSHRDFV